MSLFRRNKNQGTRYKDPVYVSKLTGKKSVMTKENTVSHSQGVRIGYMRRCINVILSDINVLCSIWKPRVVYKEPENVREDLYE